MALWQACRGAIVSAVNVKFLRFTYAFVIAAIVGTLTLAGVTGIAYSLVTTCSLTCRSIPLALVSTETVSDLSCVGFRTRALQLSISAHEQSRQTFSSGQPSNIWTTFDWTTPAATIGKCSYLHATACGLQEWLATFKGLVAIESIATSSASVTTAAWPDATSLYETATSLDDQTASVMSLATATARITAAGVQRLLTVGNATLGVADTTIMQAPTFTACCDINTENSKLGEFGGGSTRFVVNIQGKESPSMSLSSCSTSSTSSKRCSWVEMSTSMVLPPSDVINQRLCPDYFDANTNSYQAIVGVSAAVCQMLGSPQAGNQSARHDICLNGTMPNVQVPLLNYYSVTGHCPNASHPSSTAVAKPKPWLIQQQAATVFLLPLAHEFGMAITLYMANAKVDTTSAAQGLNAINSDNEAASWWMENYLYCCSQTCNDWLTSIGSALGYEAYIKGAIAMLVIVVYLAVHKSDRLRLGLTGFKGLADIAFEGTSQPTEDTLPAGNTMNTDSKKGHESTKGTNNAANGHMTNDNQVGEQPLWAKAHSMEGPEADSNAWTIESMSQKPVQWGHEVVEEAIECRGNEQGRVNGSSRADAQLLGNTARVAAWQAD